ncbi:hypothetical protein M885DRAFT_504881 [Pelagophyceae sp. CCMP2097]|nr:hypothetical protein M885DRAFT_504881 [Pelagophyceae sp. CCMP2097]
MQFTPQQLAGAQRYGSKTRVGNWQEDKCLEETKLKDFRSSQFAGTLMMNDLRSKDANYNRRVNLSPPRDGVAHFGDTVMLVSSGTGSAVSVDLTEKVIEAEPSMRLVTASKVAPGAPAVARTAFTIVPVDEASGFSPRPLRFGEGFRLACSDFLLVGQGVVLPSFYLASTLKNERNASRIANQQPTFMTQKVDCNSIWTIEKIPSSDVRCGIIRQLSIDECVPAFPRSELKAGGCEAVVVQHRGTKGALSTHEKNADYTDFGRELEVSCHNYFGSHKVEALSSESKGYTTGATNARLEQTPNHFTLVVADDGDDFPEPRLPPKQSALNAIDAARDALRDSPGSLEQLEALAHDCPGNVLDREDLAVELKRMHLGLDDFVLQTLLDAFDDARDGMIDLHQFIGALFE